MPDKMLGLLRILSGFFISEAYVEASGNFCIANLLESAMINKNITLTEGKIWKVLLRFAVGFLITSFMQALYGAVDLFVVGRFDGSSSVSAVAIGSQFMQTITGIVLGISMGGTVLIGQAIGEKNDKRSARAVGTLSILFLILAAVLTVILTLSTDFITGILETPAEAYANTRNYIFICSIGVPFIVGYNAVSGIFRGIGDSKTPIYFVFIACAANIILDFLFVGGFKLGASGAALATVIAQALSFTVSLIFIKGRGFSFAVRREDFKLDAYSVKRILKVGSPLALQDALVNVSFLTITAIINTMGLAASASVGVVEKIIVFAMLPPSAFASAVATMTAQNVGAGKPDRALKSLKYGIGFSLIFGAGVCIYAQLLPQTLTQIFTKDKEVIEMSALYFKSYSIDCILVSFIFCMNSYFSGYSKAFISFAHSMVATFGVRIPMSYFMSKIPNVSLYLMGMAAPAASLVSIIVCFAYFYVINKKKMEDTYEKK